MLNHSGQEVNAQGLWPAKKNHPVPLERYVPGQEGVGMLTVGLKHLGRVNETTAVNAGRIVPI